MKAAVINLHFGDELLLQARDQGRAWESRASNLEQLPLRIYQPNKRDHSPRSRDCTKLKLQTLLFAVDRLIWPSLVVRRGISAISPVVSLTGSLTDSSRLSHQKYPKLDLRNLQCLQNPAVNCSNFKIRILNFFRTRVAVNFGKWNSRDTLVEDRTACHFRVGELGAFNRALNRTLNQVR